MSTIDTRDAELAARQILDALDAERWDEVAAFVHDHVVQRLHHETKERLAFWQAPTQPDAEMYLRQDPDMPRDTAEYLASKARQSRALDPDFTELFGGVASAEQFEGMTAVEYAASYLRSSDPRVRGRERPDLEDEPGGPYSGGQCARQLLGMVDEGDELAHAVYRIRWSENRTGTLFDHVDVLTLHRTDDGWRIISLELNGLPRNMWFWIGMPDVGKRP